MSDSVAAPRRAGTVGRAAMFAAGAGIFAAATYSATLQMAGGLARPLESTLYAAPSQTSQLRLTAAHELLARQPMSPVPFLVAAENSAAQGDLTAATNLYEQALLRNPRSVAVRLWLVERYLRQSRFADAVVQLDAVMRIRPTLRRQLATVIVPLVGAPEARRAVAAALIRNPEWKSDFLDIAARNTVIAPAYYELLYALGGKRGFALSNTELTRIVDTALRRGDYRSAAMLYSRYVPRPTDTANLAFDGDFRGSPGPPPFNWQFPATASGYATTESTGVRGRLDVHVFGGEPSVLARQSMLVLPGSYALSTTIVADAGTVEGLSWRLVCDRDRRELGRVEIASAAPGPPIGGAAILVPVECPVVSLILDYLPPPRAVLGTTALASVSVTRIDGPPQ